MKERFTISSIEMAQLSSEDFEITRMKEWYLTRLIRLANELGLQGKKIKEICRIDEKFANEQTYIDFILEEPKS